MVLDNTRFRVAELSKIGILAASQSDRAEIKKRIEAATARTDIIVATHVGFERGPTPRFFVYGDGSVISPLRDLAVLPLIVDNGRFQKAGNQRTYEKRVSAIIRNQPIPVTLFFFALTQIIKPFVADTRYKAENMMFELVGPTTTYKSALACTVAGSIWGKAHSNDRYARDWNMTDQKIEELFAAFNDHLLILDEATLAGTSEKARAEKVLNTVHRLSSGQGRARTGAEPDGHSLGMISTSNQPIRSILPASEEVQRALEVRLISFELTGDNSSFFTRKPSGFPSIKEAMDEIFDVTRENYGLLARRLIHRVLLRVQRDKEGLIRLIEQAMSDFITKADYKARDAHRAPYRRIQPFALAYAAATVAFETGTLMRQRWGNVLRNIFRAWADHGSLEQPCKVHASLVSFMRDSANIFVDVREGKKPMLSDKNFARVAGFIRQAKDKSLCLAVPKHAKAKLGMPLAVMKQLKISGVLRSGQNLQTKLCLRRTRDGEVRDVFYNFQLEEMPKDINLRRDGGN